MLLDAAIEAKAIRPGYKAIELLQAVAALGRGGHDEQPVHLGKMVELLVDGLRYGQPVPVLTTAKRHSSPASESASSDATFLHVWRWCASIYGVPVFLYLVRDSSRRSREELAIW
jgi:hypothetical protein